MKIFSNKQIQQWDKVSIAAEGISSLDLMNRASAAFVERFLALFPKTERIHIFVGPGNNGGDGLAIGRMLCDKHLDIQLWDCSFSAKKSPDFLAQEALLPKHGRLNYDKWETTDVDFFKKLGRDTILIDALFGTGLNRPLSGAWENLIAQINKAEQKTIAVDVPSGLFCDTPTTGLAIEADYTISFQNPKLAFLFPENAHVIGEWQLVDIGLDVDYHKVEPAPNIFLQKKQVKGLLKKRAKFSHKGTFGHAALVGGTKGMVGAMVLATRACLRSGVGLTTAFVPKTTETILQIAAPEAICRSDFSKVEFENFKAIGIGCGWGKAKINKTFLHFIFSKKCKALVLDADALNVLSESKKIFDRIPEQSILTPHPKEFERLFGKTEDSFGRLELQRRMAQKHKCVIVLKGAHTSIACPNGIIYFNSTGNAGMATGGTGDVLTGLLTGLLAQGYDIEPAALLGVYLHGLAGDLAAKKWGEEALKAGDLADYFGAAFKELA